MLRRKRASPNSQRNSEDADASSLRARVADGAWIAQDRVRVGVHNGLERAGYPLQKRLLWPLQDRADSGAGRALATAAVVLLAAGAGIAGLLWAAPDGPHKTSSTQVAAAPVPAAEVEAAAEKPAEPTLQGAAPVFKPAAGKESSEVDPAQAIVDPSPESDTAGEGAATAAGAASSSSAAKPAAQDAAVDGPPAGPAAVAVAREFSDAFVVYETGGLDGDVRKAFGATATPQLSRALLRRPPRLPANVEVPRAKVLNVVPGPSHAGVYSVSVSLLRVGVTSELRLDMEQLKGKEWRVTNVLG
jgi:hypothetical protein